MPLNLFFAMCDIVFAISFMRHENYGNVRRMSVSGKADDTQHVIIILRIVIIDP